MTSALGNGAEFLLPPNFSRPLINLISEAGIMSLCHQIVSVRLGIKSTTVLPLAASWTALAVHLPISLP